MLTYMFYPPFSGLLRYDGLIQTIEYDHHRPRCKCQERLKAIDASHYLLGESNAGHSGKG